MNNAEHSKLLDALLDLNGFVVVFGYPSVLACERCHRNGDVRKLTDRVGHLLRLRLQINEATCHFFGLSYCYFQSFAGFGISVCRRPYTVNSKRPVPHIAIFCRKYLDLSTFVFKACHGIQGGSGKTPTMNISSACPSQC